MSLSSNFRVSFVNPRFRRLPFLVHATALALCVTFLVGCGSSDKKEPAPKAASNGAAATVSDDGTPTVDLDSMPVDPITIEDFFKEQAVAKYVGKRVTWKVVMETVGDYEEHPAGFSATGFPVEFEGLKEPKQEGEGIENIGEFSNKYNEYAKKEIARVGQTVTFFFKDRETHDKLKSAIGKRATISGIVAASPISNSADLNHCRLISVDN